MPSVIRDIAIIDADTHVVEPPDLWTSRVSSASAQHVPHVRWDDRAGDEAWFIGDQRLAAVGNPAMAGWGEYPPDHPRRWADIDPVTWDARLRLERMDSYGIHAQVLYPNVALFDASKILGMRDAGLQLECVRAYNDFQVEWGSVAPDRYLAMASLPFWDLSATIAEMERCRAMGHRGVIFSQDPGYFGLPVLTDRHWDPMWAAAEEMGLPINFHIASGDLSPMAGGHPDNGPHANYASHGVSFFMSNARTIAQLVCGGICHRFPDLNFVSVESGVGWIPYALDALDWQWKNCGVAKEHPEYELLPSEYFRRQIYGCFWFEAENARYAIERLGPDNILYETDFPHPTSMSPGPASTAVAPNEFLDHSFGDLPEATLRKILHDNAARLYRVR
ncbi:MULTISPECIES: amidohydrolase family protein [unclassified Pseudofrankia]|uniref:amidohydrolase family protein n=2 Tax=Pseudofrankia TaxID=2994363 RepID=UPI0008D976E4|nr:MULTISPECIES: amidohydrolase family protein [unclassified Pseudofrankia]MDT3446540.1 amidohydrolase family protein [Pseudofrankia sp. BMG5.37]OHV58713.1 amidohydrolase [Pseudofrankia sp. BMG5.36]